MVVAALTMEWFIVVMQQGKLIGHPFLKLLFNPYLVLHDGKLGDTLRIVIN